MADNSRKISTFWIVLPEFKIVLFSEMNSMIWETNSIQAAFPNKFSSIVEFIEIFLPSFPSFSLSLFLFPTKLNHSVHNISEHRCSYIIHTHIIHPIFLFFFRCFVTRSRSLGSSTILFRPHFQQFMEFISSVRVNPFPFFFLICSLVNNNHLLVSRDFHPTQLFTIHAHQLNNCFSILFHFISISSVVFYIRYRFIEIRFCCLWFILIVIRMRRFHLFCNIICFYENWYYACFHLMRENLSFCIIYINSGDDLGCFIQFF